MNRIDFRIKLSVDEKLRASFSTLRCCKTKLNIEKLKFDMGFISGEASDLSTIFQNFTSAHLQTF
jgi:hypothetical protein